MIAGPKNIGSVFRAYGNCMPPEGPKALPLVFNYTSTATQFIADLSSLRASENISYFQSLFVDNSLNDAPLVITIPSSQQRIEVLPGWQGYIAGLIPNEPKLVFDSTPTVGAVVRIHLLNFPVSNHLWPSGVTAYIPVTDIALAAIIANGALNVSPLLQASNTLVREQLANLTATLSFAAVGPSNLIAAPPAGDHIYLEALEVDIDPAATLAIAGSYILDIRAGTTVFSRHTLYIPAAAITTPGKLYHETLYPRMNLPNTTALTVAANVALTAGAARINASYTVNT